MLRTYELVMLMDGDLKRYQALNSATYTFLQYLLNLDYADTVPICTDLCIDVTHVLA